MRGNRVHFYRSEPVKPEHLPYPMVAMGNSYGHRVHRHLLPDGLVHPRRRYGSHCYCKQTIAGDSGSILHCGIGRTCRHHQKWRHIAGPTCGFPHHSIGQGSKFIKENRLGHIAVLSQWRARYTRQLHHHFVSAHTTRPGGMHRCYICHSLISRCGHCTLSDGARQQQASSQKRIGRSGFGYSQFLLHILPGAGLAQQCISEFSNNSNSQHQHTCSYHYRSHCFVSRADKQMASSRAGACHYLYSDDCTGRPGNTLSNITIWQY